MSVPKTFLKKYKKSAEISGFLLLKFENNQPIFTILLKLYSPFKISTWL